MTTNFETASKTIVAYRVDDLRDLPLIERKRGASRSS